MTRLTFLASLIVITTIAIPAPGHAQWSIKQQSEFYTDCLDACRKNDKVSDARKPQCRDYCNCVIEDGQKVLNEADYDELSADFAAGRSTPKVKTLQGLAPVCNRRVFTRQ